MKIQKDRLMKKLVVLAGILLLGSPLTYAQQIEYYHTDALGSVRAVTDQNGEVLERHDYTPFGEEWDPEDSSNPLRFTGKERDAETGWDYFGARYYGADIGRFTTVDPVTTFEKNLVDPQRWNRYAYAKNNPTIFTDPDGKKIRYAQGSTSHFKAEFSTTIQYLNEGKVSGIIAQLESRPEIVTVKEGTELGDTSYDDVTNTIVYNPHSALKTTSGGTQSPALGFLHEADHALQHIRNRYQYNRDMIIPDLAYGNAEERRVITGSETQAARKLGEDIRMDWEGEVYRVPHADSRKP